MKCHSVFAITAFAMLIALLASMTLNSGLPMFATPYKAHAQRRKIPGHIVLLLQNLKPRSTTPNGMLINLSVGLKLRNTGELNALLAAQENPASPLYHKYLTPQGFAARFSPTQDTISKVSTYLRNQGIHITSVPANRMFINATGSVSKVEQTFGVTLNDYVFKGRLVYAPSTDPSVPDSIANVINNIVGLDNVTHYLPLNSYKVQQSKTTQGKGQRQPGPRGGYTPSELRTAYNINPLISAGADGTGQTVGIFELDGYNSSDVDTYLSRYNLGTPKYSNVLVDGADTSAGQGAIEVELDMEIISAIAPEAKQKIYIGPNSGTGVNDTYNKIVTDDTAKVTSISWGQCEASSGNAELSELDNIFKQGAAQGQSFFAASGDSGAYDCNDNNLSVDSPADDPFVVGVGGTKLQTGNGGSYASESAWENPQDTQRNFQGAGSGGGKSSYFSRPSYQSGPNLTDDKRMLPDVSADADPRSGYSIYCTAGGGSGWLVVGGTSAAAPLWAGIATNTNQYLRGQNQAGLGNAHESIYKLYNTSQTYPAYHDITTGDNLYYKASTGYDMATGIGTPDAWSFARDLVSGAPTPTPTVTPTPVSGSIQLISNGDFENGNASWQEKSQNGFEIVDSTNPHSGQFSAYLCGYHNCNDTIAQTITLPSSSQHIILSYWVYVGKNNPTKNCADSFSVGLTTANGTPIKVIQKLCNSNTQGWTQYAIDLTAILANYQGQSIRVYFNATGTSRLGTDFFVDDVALNIKNS